MNMFCYQCEQTAKGTGCTLKGVCGKEPEVAALQDLLTWLLKGLSQVALEARSHGLIDPKIDKFAGKAIFMTLTNVNFDPERFAVIIHELVKHRESLIKRIINSGKEYKVPDGPATYQASDKIDVLVAQGQNLKLFEPQSGENEDIFSLKSIITLGIRGIAAYADHAAILGKTDDSVFSFIYEALVATLDKNLSLENALALVLKCGESNLKAMELLDAGNTEHFGHPVPTSVPLGYKAGKAILISGHDLADLEELLKQTEGKGIFIYTHGEMLPAHGYPLLKKYPHFFGHYGTAWQNQHKEFEEFPGAILMTTNCIQKPKDSYKGNIFTCGNVGWSDVTHIDNRDFSPVIKKALEMNGFSYTNNGKSVMVGFARNSILSVADKVIDGVKSGAIKHFFLVGGCDGAKPGRNYYTEFVEKTPKDTIVLTLACGKFRFFDRELGDIGGIPRLLDVGQCNDAYSAVQIAIALANAFNCGVNDLPLSLILSWYEQKAVSILLTLLYLGIKDIRLGPSLPAFITPNVLNILIEKFDIKPISTAENDLKAILG
jgi:hydroxylamine reductase